jgi:hypothetical protein
MFHERLPNVSIRLLHNEREEQLHMDLDLTTSGEINLSQLVGMLR